MSRRDEIHYLLQHSPDQIKALAGEHLVVCDDLDALHERMADDICNEIIQQNEAGLPARLILPVGPTGQYPPLLDRLLERDVSLANCHFFFMDEYCAPDGRTLPESHPLSFKGIARQLFLDYLPGTPAQVVFPDEHNIHNLPDMIAEVGGIDTCYGGIGIHGHVAFNEPEAGIAEMSCRRVRLNDFTVTINAVRAHVGGNLAGFPREAYTLGMKEILAARRIRLYCRNGTPYDWANTVLRLAVLGTPGDDYPVTHIRQHPDYVIVTDENTLQTPRHIL